MIPYGKHFLDEDDIQEVIDILRNGTLTQGIKVDEFEERFSSYLGSKYAIAVSSGTAALHLACLAEDISKGHNVITSANTFVSDALKIINDYKIIHKELTKYGKKLNTKTEVVALSKADLVKKEKKYLSNKIEKEIGKKAFIFSSITRDGIEDLKKELFEKCSKINDK